MACNTVKLIDPVDGETVHVHGDSDLMECGFERVVVTIRYGGVLLGEVLQIRAVEGGSTFHSADELTLECIANGFLYGCISSVWFLHDDDDVTEKEFIGDSAVDMKRPGVNVYNGSGIHEEEVEFIIKNLLKLTDTETLMKRLSMFIETGVIHSC